MRLSMAGLVVVLTGCGLGADYRISHQEYKNPPGYETIQIFADIALQRHNFGEFIGRCQIQFAFSPVPPKEDTEETDEVDDTNVDMEPWVVANPEKPGTCAFSIEPKPNEIQPGDPDDNWYVSGSIVGPDEIYLHSDVVDLRLPVHTLEDGSLRYELPVEDCDDISFPISSVLTLDVPEGETADIDNLPGFYIEEALVVGPDVIMTSPSVLPESGMEWMGQSIDEDMGVEWWFDGDIPTIDGLAVYPEVLIKIYNQDLSGSANNEWLVCRPSEDGRFSIPSEDLAQLTANSSTEDPNWFASVTIHTTTESPSFTVPWGEPVQLRAHISEGGTVVLYEP